MGEWFYKATPKKVTFEATRDLAIKDGFLCRSAFEDNETRADNTQYVHFGDLIHLYYAKDGVGQAVGSFRIIGPNKHPLPARFQRGVAQTTLQAVTDPEFEAYLLGLGGEEGYLRDPVEKPPDAQTPAYDDAPFKGRATLVKGPDAKDGRRS